MSVGRVDTLPHQLLHPLAVAVDVDRIARGVAALDDDRPGAKCEQVASRGAPFFQGRHSAPKEDLRLGQVGRQDRGQRQQLPAQGEHRVVAQQPGAALGDHHRVDDQVVDRVVAHGAGDGFDDRDRRKHPGLRRGWVEVLHHAVDLGHDQLHRQFEDVGDRDRVLGRDRGDRRGAVDAKRREGLEVGLDPSAAAGVGAGDGKRDHGHARERPRRRNATAATMTLTRPDRSAPWRASIIGWLKKRPVTATLEKRLA